MSSSSHVIARNDRLGIFVAVITTMIFGIYPAASRAAYADGANEIFVLVLTTLVRSLMLLAFCFMTGKKLFQSRADTKAALTGGFCQTLSVIGIIAGLVFIPGPLVLIIVFTHTLMLLFFMAWRGEVKLDAVTVGTTVVALGGLTLVLDLWHEQPGSNWIGIGLSFMAALATVIRLYVYGQQVLTRSPAVVGAECYVVTLGLVLLTMLFKSPLAPQTMQGWVWALTSAFSLGFGSFGMFYGIALMGAFRWSLFCKIEPIFTSIFSVLILGEFLKMSQYVGIALVLSSLVLYQILTSRASSSVAEV